METVDTRMTRIGVFYDGNFFWHVSTYYNYAHPRKARLSIKGLHEFICEQVSKSESVDKRYCQIVDAHYFRGRFSAQQADERQKLMTDRVWDDVLMREGVVTHYLPMKPRGEKGIDVWFALEAFELAIYKRFNVCVLIACDGDYVPLARKLNTLGTRVMVLGWDFSYTDESGESHVTTTSEDLLKEVTYPIAMDMIIDDKTRKSDSDVNNLFLPKREGITSVNKGGHEGLSNTKHGTIKTLNQGFGFIKQNDGNDLFFHWKQLTNRDFNELKVGDSLEFALGQNDKGPVAINIKIKDS